MSEITRGVIGMPFKLAMGSEMSRRQFHACAQEVFVEKERLEARLHEVAVCCATAEQERDQLKAENERLELENEDTLKKFEEVVEGFTKLSAEVLELRQQLAIPSDVLADCEALRLENEALRKDAERYRFVVDCPIRTTIALSRKAHEADFDLSGECDRLMQRRRS